VALTINAVSMRGAAEGAADAVDGDGGTAPGAPGPADRGTTQNGQSGSIPGAPGPGGDAAALVFSALADPTRRQVVQLLGTRPWRAGELAAATGASSPAMSRHLRVLLRAGLVADERLGSDARARVFRLRPQSLAALQAWLDQLQAQWDEQLAAFKRHVDGGPQR
jgi:DNA-binding transcriptional ArsR family regulator